MKDERCAWMMDDGRQIKSKRQKAEGQGIITEGRWT
jgi:hypothetical protein